MEPIQPHRKNTIHNWEQIFGCKQKEESELLSRDCDGCSQLRMCKRRYNVVEKGSKVYCPDGTAHLID
jgi:hypothetical protein